MSKIIALYGPPGSGKTTIIKYAQKQGYFALDIEKMGNSYEQRLSNFKKRLLEAEMHSFALFGAADIKIHDFPSGTVNILLLPTKKEYTKRFKNRNTIHPHKSNQDERVKRIHAKQYESQFDLEIVHMTIEETMNIILDLVEKETNSIER